MNTKKIDKVILLVGYSNLNDYLLKLVLPILSSVVLISLIIPFIVPVGFVFSIFLILLTMGGLIGYPLIKYSAVKQNINENLHFFITYAGTIATMKISRHALFKKIAEKKVFGEISKTFEKVIYLSKDWNMGFVNSCRLMGSRTPSRILGDFLDRFAVVMDFGEELDTFLYDEQGAVLDDYSVEYKKSLEIIKMIQELFMALSVSFAFLVSTILLAPLLIALPVNVLLIYALVGLVVMDVVIIFAVKGFIPRDQIFHDLAHKSLGQLKIEQAFKFAVIISGVFFVGLLFLTSLSFITVMALGSLPLLYPGFLAVREEEIVRKRDVQFPVYARILGSAIEVRNGGVISSLKSTQMHDFGVINDMSVNLYRRLRLGTDKFKSWYHYAVDSGSNLVNNFSKIFSESIYLGGNAEKIGEIVSNNVQHLLSLRKLRAQLAQGLTGVFYGITIGVSLTIFITFRISEKMSQLFSTTNIDDEMTVDFAQTIMPMNQEINFGVALVLIMVMLIIHAFTSSWILKIIDGGSNYSSIINLIIMIWIIALLYWTIPSVVDMVLPDMSTIW
ncbi:MAG: hypothetical protein ACLFN8_00745 [Candidatus Woesearchaeota archaeon]